MYGLYEFKLHIQVYGRDFEIYMNHLKYRALKTAPPLPSLKPCSLFFDRQFFKVNHPQRSPSLH